MFHPSFRTNDASLPVVFVTRGVLVLFVNLASVSRVAA